MLSSPILQVDLDDVLAPLKLDGGAPGEIHVSFATDEHIQASSLTKRKPGDKLTIIGITHDWSPDEKTLEFGRAWVLP